MPVRTAFEPPRSMPHHLSAGTPIARDTICWVPELGLRTKKNVGSVHGADCAEGARGVSGAWEGAPMPRVASGSVRTAPTPCGTVRGRGQCRKGV